MTIYGRWNADLESSTKVFELSQNIKYYLVGYDFTRFLLGSSSKCAALIWLEWLE